MNPNPRQTQLLELVQAQGSASIEFLAETFSVTLQTVRRDVQRLAEAGYRTHAVLDIGRITAVLLAAGGDPDCPLQARGMGAKVGVIGIEYGRRGTLQQAALDGPVVVEAAVALQVIRGERGPQADARGQLRGCFDLVAAQLHHQPGRRLPAAALQRQLRCGEANVAAHRCIEAGLRQQVGDQMGDRCFAVGSCDADPGHVPPGFPGGGDLAVGADAALAQGLQGGVIPADQRLEAADDATVEGDDGLIDDAELVALEAADGVISRAGASSLAELAALQLPSILVPLPTAQDNHQFHNADALARSGAALLLQQSNPDPLRLQSAVLSLLQDSALRNSMQQALKQADRPDAASAIAESGDTLAMKALLENTQSKLSDRSVS